MTLRIIPLVLFVCLLAPVRAADFTGTFECKEDGETTVLTLVQQGNKVTGTAKFADGELSVVGTVTGEQLVGTATMKGQPITLYVKGTLDGDSLTIKIAADAAFSEPETQVFHRVKGNAGDTGSEKPKGDKEGGQKYSKEPTEVLRNGKEYTHASGGKLKYPSDWSVKEQDGYLQILPPDAKEGELVIVKADSASGATDPGSKEVLSYLDSQLGQSVPDAKREGEVERAVAGAGKGVIVSWTGTANGTKVFVRAYVTIIRDKGVALVAAGPRDAVEKRDKVLRQIFQSIGWGQGKVDTQLVGTWNYWGYKGSTDGKYGREEKAQAILSADGRFSYSNSAETNISADTGGLSSRRGSGWGGTWTADGSSLILNFEDGSSESFSYRFEQQGQNTFLVVNWEDKKNKMEWSRG